MAAFSSEINVLITFWVDGSSSISVEEVEGFLYLKDLFFSEAGPFKVFSIELLGFGTGLFRHKFKFKNS